MLQKVLVYLNKEDYDYIKKNCRDRGDFSQFIRSAVKDKIRKENKNENSSSV